MKAIYSMTGYGKGVSAVEARKITVELKSVNHRFLDLSFRIPRQLQFAEDLIRKAIGDSITRGHVDIFLNYEDNREMKSVLILDQGLMISYIEEADKLTNLGVKNNFGTAEILSNKDIVSTRSVEDDESILKELVQKATQLAIDSILEMKVTEGKKLVGNLLEKINELEINLEKIKTKAPILADEYRTKLSLRIKELLLGVEVDQTRIAQEVAIFTDKSNIDEEITRLNGHIEHYRKIIELGGAVGKSLDFLTQEANREANTIGSKSNDMQITENILQIKNIIEMMREQIQNLE